MVAFGCGAKAEPRPTTAPSDAHPTPDARVAQLTADAAASRDAPQNIAGKLAPAPATAKTWPDKICVEGTKLMFENRCGCNDKLLCNVTSIGRTLRVTLDKDPSQMPACRDCFAMIPARCALPDVDPWRVEINGAFAFDLPAHTTDGTCWEVP